MLKLSGLQDGQGLAASEQEKAENLRRACPGWRIWWGRATREWLASPPSWVRLHCGLGHDPTADGPAAQIAWITRPVAPLQFHGPRSP